MTPAELCERAVERLESTGWKQHSIGPKEGPNCLLGALIWEDSTRDEWLTTITPLQYAVRGAISHYIGVPVIPEWNDHEDRSEFEVIDALKTVGKMFANGEITMEPVS